MMSRRAHFSNSFGLFSVLDRSLVMSSIVINILCYEETQTKWRPCENRAGLCRVSSAEQMGSRGTAELSNPHLWSRVTSSSWLAWAFPGVSAASPAFQKTLSPRHTGMVGGLRLNGDGHQWWLPCSKLRHWPCDSLSALRRRGGGGIGGPSNTLTGQWPSPSPKAFALGGIST